MATAASTGSGAADWVVVKRKPRHSYCLWSEQEMGSPHSDCRAPDEIQLASCSSAQMECCVCYELVLSKANPLQRAFGILPNCRHCYCLDCIQKWRSLTEENKSCPVCGIESKFYIPSAYWVEDERDKQELIRRRTARIPCRHFANGRGTCPFGERCLKSHAVREGAQPQQRWRRDLTKPSPSGEEYHTSELIRRRGSDTGRIPCRNFDNGRGTCPFGERCLYSHAVREGAQPHMQRRRRFTKPSPSGEEYYTFDLEEALRRMAIGREEED